MDFQQVADAIEKSSPEIKDLLFSNEIGQALQSIAENNNLDEEASLKMIDEIGYVILGLKERSSLKNSLVSIGIQKTVVLSIIQEISREIFSKLDKIDTPKNIEEKPPEPKPEPTRTELDETDQAIIITQENKEEALRQLDKRVDQQKTSVPEITPTNLPMVEEGETAHTAPHIEQVPAPQKSEPKASLPDYRYDGGKDPYREPFA